MNILEIKTQEFNLSPDLEKSFLKGSAWQNLYIPYKFIPEEMTTLSIKDQILFLIQIYTFIAIELNLFIGTHKNSVKAIEALKQVNTERNKMINYFQNNFYVLTNDAVVENYNFYSGDKNVEI